MYRILQKLAVPQDDPRFAHPALHTLSGTFSREDLFLVVYCVVDDWIPTWNRASNYGWTPLLIAEGHRGSATSNPPQTIAEIRQIMVANGVTPPQRPPAKATNEERLTTTR